MNNIPRYWHNNIFVVSIMILTTIFIPIVFSYFQLFTYIFSLGSLQQLLGIIELSNIGIIVKLSIIMSLITLLTLCINCLIIFLVQEHYDFDVGNTMILILICIIDSIIGSLIAWLFFTTAFGAMLIIGIIFTVINIAVLFFISVLIHKLFDKESINIDNWFFLLFGNSLSFINIIDIKEEELVDWLNLNIKKWCICGSTRKIYVITKLDLINLKLTFYEKNSRLKS